MAVVERRMLGYLVSVATRRLLLRVAGEDVLMKHRIWEIDAKVLIASELSFRQNVSGSFRQIPPFRSLFKPFTRTRATLPHRLFRIQGRHRCGVMTAQCG